MSKPSRGRPAVKAMGSRSHQSNPHANDHEADEFFLVAIHAGTRCFAVAGPATIEQERVVGERIGALQGRGHAIGMAVDTTSITIMEAVTRVRRLTGYRCVRAWSMGVSRLETLDGSSAVV